MVKSEEVMVLSYEWRSWHLHRKAEQARALKHVKEQTTPKEQAMMTKETTVLGCWDAEAGRAAKFGAEPGCRRFVRTRVLCARKPIRTISGVFGIN